MPDLGHRCVRLILEQRYVRSRGPRPSDPATMEKLVEFADKLTVVGADGTIEQIGFIPNHSWSHTDLYGRTFEVLQK